MSNDRMWISSRAGNQLYSTAEPTHERHVHRLPKPGPRGDQCNTGIEPVVADVIQTFWMIELFRPDDSSKQPPFVWADRGGI
jgi:hypothetical protein